MSRSTRLLILLQALRGRRKAVTASVLACELDVSERTIYRDIASLIASGAPIRGEGGVGYILEAGLFLPPLMLSEEEIDALLLGLSYVDQRGDSILRQAAQVARAKIISVLPSKIEAAVRMPISDAGPHDRNFPTDIIPLEVFRISIQNQQKIIITYLDEHKNQTERVIWPIQLGFLENVRIVTAWCELRQAFRFFRTDRILTAIPSIRYPKQRAILLNEFEREFAIPIEPSESP
ncbi:transcriptional regulator [Acinetobacter sp. ANC 4558]|uniref:helix-turn-helix transcriptional regulator n=1 Tax=Acinetobacter sp. ANC 4558 TaxID=1977876 RepID=UPI000A345B97|nr:YafY family protein [Acinetobacter sp. ANC 4558]OTG88310.1 transcriptional regulator [Acinetobacter sp. ANC 4558]